MNALLWRSRCERKGHQWLPDDGPREFIPVVNICLHCDSIDTRLPWGECLGNHPLAEHYDSHGRRVPHPTCPGPR